MTILKRYQKYSGYNIHTYITYCVKGKHDDFVGLQVFLNERRVKREGGFILLRISGNENGKGWNSLPN